MTDDVSSKLRRAASALVALRKERDALQKARTEPIAIVGTACRLPGGANDLDAFARLLDAKTDAVGPIPKDRFDVADVYDAERGRAGKSYVKEGAFLASVDGFDAPFFGISPREAALIDPQHRLLAECAWEALEDAGISPARLRGEHVGVYVGIGPSDYGRAIAGADEAYALTGTGASFSAGRIAFLLGLHGPAVAVDTACSSSLVALHLACKALRSGECDVALAGGVQVMLGPELFVLLSRFRALAPDGRCKAFSDKADGYGRGEGCGVLALKRLSDAERDGDTILALVRGTAINHDGSSSGLTTPNGSAQRDVIERALADAGLAPADVDHVEAHGTGTSLGDPIEIEALAAAYGPGRDAPLAISTAKSYIGHLESASGVTGVLKVLASLDREVLPASLHTERLSTEVPWETLPVRVLRDAAPWPRTARPRRAGVSSFGMSGTNAHVILEEAPLRKTADAATDDAFVPNERPSARAFELVLLSARSEGALEAQAERLAVHLEAHRELALGDVAFTLATGREPMPHRRAFVVRDGAALVEALQSTGARSANAAAKPAGRVAWVFSGQGAQIAGMGRSLHAEWPAFRDAFDACIAHFGEELRDVMWSDADPRLDQTGFAQPALFTFEYALATLLRSWGLVPDVLLGHSLGEIVAATIANVFSLEDATKLVAARGRLMQALPAGGAMLAIEASEATVRAALDANDAGSTASAAPLSIAAVNGPSSTVVSGDEASVSAIASSFTARGIRTKRLAVSHAFHSVLVEPMIEAFRAVATTITYDMPSMALVSNVTGKRIGLEIASADYWVRHVREAVRFADGVASAAAETFVEIGPRSVLLGAVGSSLADSALVPAVRGPHDETRSVLAAAASLFTAGAAIEPRGLFPNGGRRVALPKYAWQHARCWANVPAPSRAEGRRGRWPLSGIRQKTPGGIIHHTMRVGVRHQPYLGAHRVFGHVVVAGAFQIGTVLAVAQETWPGETLALADVEFLRALTLASDDVELELHAVLTPDGNGGHTFEIASTPLDAETWTAHARGRIERGGEATLRSVAALTADTTSDLDAAAFYARMDATELAWGPAWQWTTGGRTGDRVAVSDIALRLPHDGPMHPVLLDNAFGMGVYTQATPQEPGTRPLPFVPFTMQRIRLLRAPEGDVRCGAIRRHAEGSAADVCVVDLAFEDARGTFAEIEAFAARRARENALVNGVLAARNAAKDATRESEVSYRVAFEPKPIEASPSASRAPASTRGKPWVVVAKPGCAIATAIAKTRAAILAEPEAIATVAADAAGVVYVFGEEPGDLPDRAAARGVEALALVKRLAKMPIAPARVVWVTSGAVDAGGEDVDASASVVWGLGRTVIRERPELGLELADLDTASHVAFATALDVTDGEPETAWRNETRHVARLARVALLSEPATPKLRTDGTALVTGGLGALGLHVAHALAAHGFRRLILTGRRGFATPGAAEAIDELTARGVVVTVAAIDVADRVALDGVLATIPADAPLRAVFHTAGVLDDGVLDEQDPSRFARVFAPKVDGTWNLHEATRGLDLDAFVLFSSAVSVFGSPGQAGYTAANAFLDGFASHRRALGLSAQSFGWGAWGGGGMAARLDDAGRTRMTRLGFGTFTPEAAIAALDRALADDGPRAAPHIVLAALDLPVLAAHAGRLLDGLVPPNGSGTMNADATKRDAAPLRERFATLSPPEREQAVVALVREETAAALRLASAAAVALDVPLQRMGLDSLTALEIRNRLQARCGESLPATMLFEHPTPGAVATELVARLVARLAKQHAAAAPQTFVDFEL